MDEVVVKEEKKENATVKETVVEKETEKEEVSKEELLKEIQRLKSLKGIAESKLKEEETQKLKIEELQSKLLEQEKKIKINELELEKKEILLTKKDIPKGFYKYIEVNSKDTKESINGKIKALEEDIKEFKKSLLDEYKVSASGKFVSLGTERKETNTADKLFSKNHREFNIEKFR